MNEDKLIELSKKAGDEYAKLGRKLEIAIEALTYIRNWCDGDNETHAGFYYKAQEALFDIDDEDK